MTYLELGKAVKVGLSKQKSLLDAGKRSYMRNPPGKDLAHESGSEAAKVILANILNYTREQTIKLNINR